jgi:hypothetical protein
LKRISLVIALLLLVVALPSMAATTFTPDSFGGPFCLSPAFGTAACSLTNQYINGGVVFSNTAVFNDPPHAFSGINGSNVVDLIAPVLGSIVVFGTTNPGLTDSVSVLAGGANANTLRLDVFDVNNVLLGFSLNSLGGVSSFGVNVAGIRSFSVWTPGNDTFGVQSITVGGITPIGGGQVPEPSSFALLLGGFALIGRKLVRR